MWTLRIHPLCLNFPTCCFTCPGWMEVSWSIILFLLWRFSWLYNRSRANAYTILKQHYTQRLWFPPHQCWRHLFTRYYFVSKYKYTIATVRFFSTSRVALLEPASWSGCWNAQTSVICISSFARLAVRGRFEKVCCIETFTSHPFVTAFTVRAVCSVLRRVLRIYACVLAQFALFQRRFSLFRHRGHRLVRGEVPQHGGSPSDTDQGDWLLTRLP